MAKKQNDTPLETTVFDILNASDGAYDFGDLEQAVQSRRKDSPTSLAVRTAAWNLIEQNRAQLTQGFRVSARRK